MRFLVSAAALLAMAGTGLAATLKVPQQYGTIQEAVDASSDGDTIKVSPGIYREHVVVENRNRIRFLGKRAVWDGNIEGGVGTCLSIAGDDVLVQGFRFRNANPAISLEGNRAVIQKCVFVNCWNWSVEMSSDDAAFLKNTVLTSYRGVSVGGNAPRVEGNRFLRTYYRHVLISGNDAVVQKNVHTGFYDEGSVTQITGDGASVVRNVMRNCYGTMVYLTGEDGTVAGNTLTGGYMGVDAYGNGITVSGNRLRTFYYYMIRTNGTGNTVEGNTLASSYYAAIRTSGTDVAVLDNRIADVVDDDGIHSDGDGSLIEGNSMETCYGSGIRSDGAGVTIRGNEVTDTWSNFGIYVNPGVGPESPILVEGNTVTDGTDWGIYVVASMVTVRNNTASGNGAHYYGNFYVSGTGNTLEGNVSLDAGGAGYSVNGTGWTLKRCYSGGAGIDGFLLLGSGGTMQDCLAENGDGQGLSNYSSNLTVTGSTFRNNALDVANQGTVANGDAGMEFVTGGLEQNPLYFYYD